MKGTVGDKHPRLAAVLTIVMTPVWVSLPIAGVGNYLTAKAYPVNDMPLMLLRLEWLGLAAATIPAIALTRVPRDKFLLKAWRAWVIFIIGMTTVAVLFDSGAGDQPVPEPSVGLALMSLVAFFAICGPAWWFNIIKPLTQRRARRSLEH